GGLSGSVQVIGKQGDGALRLEQANLSASLIVIGGEVVLGNQSSPAKTGRVNLEPGTRLVNGVGGEITADDGKYGVKSGGAEVVNKGAIFGGAGDDGTSNAADGGAGVYSGTDGDFILTNSGVITGGAGSHGGYGGAGVHAHNAGDFTLDNTGTIQGGDGG